MPSNLVRRAAAVAAIAPVVVMCAALPAAAHVTVHSDDPTPGAADSVLTFRVPNEEDNAKTVKVQVFLPTDTPLLGVLAQPTPGWQFRVRTVTLPKPIETDDGAITSAVSQVTWTGGQIPVGGYQDFNLAVGELPDQPGTLTFKALQTYSDGTVVRWIETAPEGSPEPEHPAPTLQLTAATAAPAGDHAAPVSEAASASSSNGTDRGLAIAALVVAVIAAGAAAAGLRRRSGS